MRALPILAILIACGPEPAREAPSKPTQGTSIQAPKVAAEAPPDPNLTPEAQRAFAKHGGALTWHPGAPGGGQWEYRPLGDCTIGKDQYAHSATAAVMIATLEGEEECRVCGPRRSQKGCSDAQREHLEKYTDELHWTYDTHDPNREAFRPLK